MLKRMGGALAGVLKDDSGQTMLEYIIIVAVVVVAGLAVFKVIKEYIDRQRGVIEGELNPQQP